MLVPARRAEYSGRRDGDSRLHLLQPALSRTRYAPPHTSQQDEQFPPHPTVPLLTQDSQESEFVVPLEDKISAELDRRLRPMQTMLENLSLQAGVSQGRSTHASATPKPDGDADVAAALILSGAAELLNQRRRKEFPKVVPQSQRQWESEDPLSA